MSSSHPLKQDRTELSDQQRLDTASHNWAMARKHRVPTQSSQSTEATMSWQMCDL